MNLLYVGGKAVFVFQSSPRNSYKISGSMFIKDGRPRREEEPELLLYIVASTLPNIDLVVTKQEKDV